MPIRKRNNKWRWGSKGPFDSRKKAEEVAQAAHASGYEKSLLKLIKEDINDEPSDELNEFARDLQDKVKREAAKNRHHSEWTDPHPDLLAPLSHPHAKLFLDELGEREDGTTFRQPNVNHTAYNYLDFIHRDVPMTARKHLQGLKSVEYAKQYQQHLSTGGGVPREGRYLDSAKTIEPSRRGQQRGERPHPEWLAATRKETNIHDFLAEHGNNMASHLDEQGQNNVKRLFDSVSRESPSFKPTGTFETDPDIQRYFSMEASLLKLMDVEKEGDGGGALDGLSGTVFTSSHAGIFTPTFGERGTKRRHKKNKQHQDAKRKQLMGEDKKNGLDRLVQFLQEGSPSLHKRQPDKMMTGQFQSIHVDRQTPRKQIDWRKKRMHKELEKTTEEINWKKRQEGVSKVEDHPSMAADTSSLGTSSTYPGDSEGTWTGTKPVPAKTDWGIGKTTVQKQDIPPVFGQNEIEKASPGGLHGISTLTNQNTRNANGIHPQDAFLMVDSDDDKRQQVVDQNDFEKRVRKYDEKEDDPGIEQPQAGGATAGMANFPNANMQMMEKSGWGSGIDINQDDLHRGGELDEEDADIDDDDSDDDENSWIPEDETKVKAEKEWLNKFQILHKNFVEGGNDTPVLSAILALDNE